LGFILLPEEGLPGFMETVCRQRENFDLYQVNEFVSYLLQYGELNDHHIKLLSEQVQTLRLAKGGFFSTAGRVADTLGFIVSGVLRISYKKEAGEDVTRLFLSENQFALDIESFRTGTRSRVDFEALTECTLLTLSKNDYEMLLVSIPPLANLFSKIMTAALLKKMQLGRRMLEQDAQERYWAFMDEHPGLLNRVPLLHVASYLGITPSSLSRIRKGRI